MYNYLKNEWLLSIEYKFNDKFYLIYFNKLPVFNQIDKDL